MASSHAGTGRRGMTLPTPRPSAHSVMIPSEKASKIAGLITSQKAIQIETVDVLEGEGMHWSN